MRKETGKRGKKGQGEIKFGDIFVLKDIQRLQDMFSDATGVASVITTPDGIPITKPSNFTRLCSNVIQKTQKGSDKCKESHSLIGGFNPEGPKVQSCLGCGLWEAGSGISLDGIHVANWIIGQVRNDEIDENKITAYADEIKTDKKDFKKALNEVPVMSTEQFKKVSDMLFLFANEISEKTFSNLQFKKQAEENKRTAELLKVSEDKYHKELNVVHSIFESPVDIIIFSLDRYYFYTEFTKYHKETIKKIWGVDIRKGMNMLDIISNPEDRIKAKTNFDRALNGEHFIITEYYGDETLSRISYENYYSSVRNEKEEIVGVSVFSIDVTQREQANDEIIRQRNLISSIIESSSEAIFAKDLNGKYLFINEAGAEMLGYRAADVVGRTDSELLSDATAREFRKSDENVISDGQLFIKEEEGLIGGKLYTFLSHKSPLLDNSGNVIGIIGVSNDITERKQSELALRESETKFRDVMQTAKDAIIIVDTKGIITGWNKGAESIFGYNEVDILNKELNLIIPEQYRNNHHKSIQKTVNGDETGVIGKTRELSGQHKNGTVFPLELSMSEFETASGKFFTAIIRDITLRKQSEEELFKAKEKAEESDRLKSTFLTNISHEIRTPMNGILGFTNLLKEPRLSANERQEYISIIETSSHRLLNTINDIVNISLIKAGQTEISEEETNINTLIERVCKLYQPDAANKKLELVFDKSLTECEAAVHTDSEKLFAVISGIVNNAIKFTARGSVHIGCTKSDNYFDFSVTDTGIGISEGMNDLIFEPFRQVDETNSKKFEGAGLGLTIAKAYTEMLGGSIHFESKEGKGTGFYFTIPVRPSALKGLRDIKSVTEGKKAAVKKLRVLIAEDDEISGKLISISLDKISREIITVRTGKDAVDTCRANPDIDFIVMDIDMPVMNGTEAAKQIRLFNSKVVIIAQTAFNFAGERELALEAGCNEYITKPIDFNNLKKIMSQYSEQESDILSPL
ncbi:MAG: PAS domain S-box protein [Ignavibacteriota bacterium]